MFDVIVVGKGMIGAAAFRYLSAAGVRVALLGPDEPPDWQRHNGVFASHYDEGRVTRVLDADPTWAELAHRSLKIYPEIEQQSGIQFHHPVGCLRAAAVSIKAIDVMAQVGRAFDIGFARIDVAIVNAQMPYFNFPPTTQLLWEHAPAGYINPRRLVAAQTAVGLMNGGHVIRATAKSLTTTQDHIQIHTDNDQTINGRKVLLTMGAYTNSLLPDSPVPLTRLAESILLAEVDESEKERLHGMPSLIYHLPKGSPVPSLYMIPPVRYPDGRTYVKLGSGHAAQKVLAGSDDMAAWFQSGGRDSWQDALQSVLHQTLSNLKVRSYQRKPCVLTFTQGEFPIIKQLANRIFVATGGNGAAAKSSNEIGRLAALLTLEMAWPDSLSALFSSQGGLV